MNASTERSGAGAPRQNIAYPGDTADMDPQPKDEMRGYVGSGLLEGRRALVTGGDSGIGRAVAVAFAKEGADVAIAYLSEDADAEHTVALVEQTGRRAVALRADLGEAAECRRIVDGTVDALGGLDLLVNNAGTQTVVDDFAELTAEQWNRTFAVDVAAVFHTTHAALEHLTPGGTVVNTGSINGLRGNRKLIDYSAAKGAVHALTFSLAQALLDREIRVNCVAPGPVWTPLIPATMPPDQRSRGSASRPRTAAPRSRMRSRPRTSSSPQTACRRTTRERFSRPPAARHCPADPRGR